MRLVYYSMAADTEGRCERQWTQSIRSLRRYNREIPVHIVVYGRPGPSLVTEARRRDVTVHLIEGYRACFRQALASRHRALGYYRTLHKFNSLKYCPRDVSQVLYVDCDTFFFGDVAALFERYALRQWYAREEPQTRRSHYGYQSSYVNEDRLARVASTAGVRFVPPYNTGVCMLNHGLHDQLSSRAHWLLDFAWRFLVGLRDDPRCPPRLAGLLRNSVTAQDVASAFTYPSSNVWIVEEFATWMTLGTISKLSHDVMRRDDVLQNGEFHASPTTPRCVVAHYYSSFEDDFFRRVSRIEG